MLTQQRLLDLKPQNEKNELKWFKEIESLSNNMKKQSISFTNANNGLTNFLHTKIIATVRFDYTEHLLENLMENGIRIFRINGAYCNYSDYEAMISDIERLFKNRHESPTIIFDLKGRVPRITKIHSGLTKLELKKGDRIKFLCGDGKISDSSLIHIDRNINNSIKEGDRITVDCSGSILKVVKIDYYRKDKLEDKIKLKNPKSYTNLPSVRNDIEKCLYDFREPKSYSIPYSTSNSNLNLKKESINYNKLYDTQDSSSSQQLEFKQIRQKFFLAEDTTECSDSNYLQSEEYSEEFFTLDLAGTNERKENENKMEVIQEVVGENEDTPFFDVDHIINTEADHTIVKKQNKITEVYQRIVKKHKTSIDLPNKPSSDESHNDQNSSQNDDYFHILEKTKEEDDILKTYLNRRKHIRSSNNSFRKKQKNLLICEVENPGTLILHKKVFLLGKEFQEEKEDSNLDKKDIFDLDKISSLGVNIITARINNEKVIDEIKEFLGDKEIKIFARIETSEAICNFDSIIEKCDGIIIDHGFISTKIPYEDLCVIETYIIEKCKVKQKPLFLQTNILKSMTKRAKPNVTEISNLAYMVKMGFDGLILKEELTMAHNYIEILKFLEENLLQLESLTQVKSTYEELSKYYHSNYEYLLLNRNLESLLDCAVKSTFDVPVGMIILNSDDYRLAKALSKYRPNSLIVFMTSNKLIYDYLRLIRDVSPQLIDTSKNLQSNQNNMEFFCKRVRGMKNFEPIFSRKHVILVINAYTKQESIFKNGIYFFEKHD